MAVTNSDRPARLPSIDRVVSAVDLRMLGSVEVVDSSGQVSSSALVSASLGPSIELGSSV